MNIVENFHELVEIAFNWIIIDTGGTLITKPKPGTYENDIVKFETGSMLVKVWFDRMQIFLDVTSIECPDDWFDFALILRYLKAPKDDIKTAGNYTLELNELSSLFKKYYQKIARILAPDSFSDTWRYLDYLKLKRTKDWLKDNCPKEYEDNIKKYESSLDKKILDAL